jgi:MoxR-like ATPase
VQSALLEAMQERQVTIGDTTYALPDPFVVIATQNPIEHEGTYALPEAQVDRFVMKLRVDYPRAEEELRMLGLYLDPTREPVAVQRVLGIGEIRAIGQLAARVHADERIGRYIVQLVTATRRPADYKMPALASQISFGASPRATLALAHVAKAHAFIEGREYVVPEDVKAVAHDVLRHRLVLSYEAAAEQVTSDRIIDQVLASVPVP